MEAPGRPSLQIFLCSTKFDLERERQAVRKLIQLSRNDEISMEVFGAQPNAPIETCLASVAQCDLMIVVVGFRYGKRVPGRRISFSEAEYKHGYDLGKPCFVYMRKTKPRRADLTETDPRLAERLERWKKTLLRRHTVYDFDNPLDLVTYLGTDLPRWISETTSRRDATERDSVHLALEQHAHLKAVWVYAPHPLEGLSGDAHREIRRQVAKNLLAGVKYVYFVESQAGVGRIAALARLLASEASLPSEEAYAIIEKNMEVCVLDDASFLTHYTVHIDPYGEIAVYQSVLDPERKDRITKLADSVASKTFERIQAIRGQGQQFKINGDRLEPKMRAE
jgi:hypothetical protein